MFSLQLPSSHVVFVSNSCEKQREKHLIGGRQTWWGSCCSSLLSRRSRECQRLSRQSQSLQSLDLAAALSPLLSLCKGGGGGRVRGGSVPTTCSPVIEVASFRQKMDKQKCCFKSGSEAKVSTGSFLFRPGPQWLYHLDLFRLRWSNF